MQQACNNRFDIQSFVSALSCLVFKEYIFSQMSSLILDRDVAKATFPPVQSRLHPLVGGASLPGIG